MLWIFSISFSILEKSEGVWVLVLGRGSSTREVVLEPESLSRSIEGVTISASPVSAVCSWMSEIEI